MQSYLFDDMCQMDQLSQQSIVANLIKRYKKDQIFTYIGSTLLAVNPYRVIPQLFNEEQTNKITEEILKGVVSGYPHIYKIAGRVFNNMIMKQPKQSIIISGQSGAGKTESTKYCMQLLTRLSHKKSNLIEKKILACNPLLQAFGNSKTVKNENSSRFGKYVQILFGKDHAIKGAKIQSYLLEKSRVTMVAKNERNFHVFYALLESKNFETKAAKDYAYLRNSNCYNANSINDGYFFRQIVQSFNSLEFTQDEQTKIWRLLLAILQLGNLQFDDTDFQNNEQKPCVIVDRTSIASLSQALLIPSKQLEEMLLYKTKKILKDTHQDPKNKIECQANRNTLSKAIYNSIFQFIIDKIEIVLSPINQEDRYELLPYLDSQRNYFQISILDIFGFQNFEKNSMEQLCINFTNQKLLAQYNQKVFESQINILKEDGLQDKITHIVPPSNMSIITKIEQIFQVINENTTIKQFTQANMIEAIIKKNQKRTQVMFEPTNKSIFKINHSPCIVSYSIEQFKLKNKDDLTPEISSICQKILPNNAPQEVSKSKNTILKKFRGKIQQLVNKLSEGQNHFVRCIKPNEEKRQNFVNQSYMKTQIKYLGVFETIKIRKAIFPFRKTYQDFAALYQHIFNQSKGKTHREATSIILREIQAPQSSILFGNNRVYLNSDVNNKLQKRLQEYMTLLRQKATLIQRWYRSYRAWKLWKQSVKEKYLKKRTETFESICQKIIKRKTQYMLFIGFNYIIQDSEQKLQNQKKINEQQQYFSESDICKYSQNSQIFQKIPYQFQTERIQNLIKNELVERTENFQQILNEKQLEFQNQRARLQKQKLEQQEAMNTCIIELKQALNQKERQNVTLNETIKGMKTEIEKMTLQMNRATIINQIESSQRQQRLQEKRQLQYQIEEKNLLIEELKKSSNQKIKQLESTLILIESEHERLRQKRNSTQQFVQIEQNNVTQLSNMLSYYEEMFREYEPIINQYTIQKDKFFDQKSDKNILQKTLIIEELKKTHSTVGKSQLTKKDAQIQKLRKKLSQKQEELREFHEKNKNKTKYRSDTQSEISCQQQNFRRKYSDFSYQLAIKDLKIQNLEQNLTRAIQNISDLKEKQKIILQKLSEQKNNHLRQVADCNNKIHLANQRSKRDKITITQCQKKIDSLQREIKQNKEQIIHIINLYQLEINQDKRQHFKASILGIFHIT